MAKVTICAKCKKPCNLVVLEVDAFGSYMGSDCCHDDYLDHDQAFELLGDAHLQTDLFYDGA